jgi:hypothetical protein
MSVLPNLSAGSPHRASLYRHVLAGQLDELRKRIGIVNGNFGEHLSIQLALGSLQAGDHFAVTHAAGATGGVDANDPQLAELTLAIAPVAEREAAGSNQRDNRLPVQIMATETKAFAQTARAFAALSDGFAASSARHGPNPLIVDSLG